ncbi:MAG: cbb3-type cytochrome c oxidase subunit I [Candidatus Rokuibacteriota bacterium]
MSQDTASDPEKRLTGAHMLVANVALLGGIVTGLLQGLEHAGFEFPASEYFLQSYYHSVSMHGVLNVLVWTTFFIAGFLPFISARAYAMPLRSPRLGWLTFWLMLAGLLIAAVPLAGNAATVMFTFYAPLQAHWAFYVGLTLVVVGTWLITLRLALSQRAWRAGHPDARTPLAAFMSLVTMTMWTLASIGLAASMLFMLIPWSLGLVAGTDPLLTRTLFWLTGHPIVYFWLLPAYVSWYTLVPRQAGGRLFSDPMARVSFLLFLILSAPLGLHHQVTDPGIHEGWKLFQAFLTFAVFFPSLLTFFNVVASLEGAGRARGGKGLAAWFFRLPWGDPSLAAQLLAMLMFCAGGIGGLINASYNMNLVVHNTSYVVGHFHTTVGTAVTLTYMGISYWLVPHLVGRALWSPRMALAQAWMWFVGMLIFSTALHELGLRGMPRRTMISQSSYFQPEWSALLPWVGVGGTLLFVSGILYLLNLLLTVTVSRAPAPAVPEFARSAAPPEDGPAVLNRLRPWVITAVAFLVIAYGPTLARLVATSQLNAPGFRVW